MSVSLPRSPLLFSGQPISLLLQPAMDHALEVYDRLRDLFMSTGCGSCLKSSSSSLTLNGRRFKVGRWAWRARSGSDMFSARR